MRLWSLQISVFVVAIFESYNTCTAIEGKHLSALTSVKKIKETLQMGIGSVTRLRLYPIKKLLPYIVILLILIVWREYYSGYNH